MKNVNSNFPLQRIFLPPFLLMALFMAASCSTKIYFPESPIVPGADPKAEVKKNKEGDYVVELDVNNLALPERLTPPKRNYVVWVNTEGQGVRNVGELKNRRGMFSNSNRASFEGSIPLRPTQIFVTAENNTDLQFPGEHTVLKSDVFRIKK
jgi:predicted small lipoprotein YifL